MGLSLDQENLWTSAVADLEAAQAENEQLRAALESRGQIGIAQGMLMLRYGLTQDRAFQYLARRSQDSNIKLRDVALDVARELSGCPERELRVAPGRD